MSYNKLKSIFNDENNDKENETVEDQQEYELKLEKYNECVNDITNTCINLDYINKKVKDVRYLINVLKEDGIDPISLKILCNNKFYTNELNIKLPSVESLNNNTNNLVADQIVKQLEYKIENITSGYEGLADKISDAWDKFKDVFRSNETKIENIRKKIVNMEVDEEKCKDKTVEAFDFKIMQYFENMLNKLMNLKIPSPKDKKGIDKFNDQFYDISSQIRKEFIGLNPNTAEYKTMYVKNIINDMISENDKYYLLVKKLKDNEDKLKDKVSAISSFYTQQHDDEDSEMLKNGLQYIPFATRFITGMQNNYLRLASAVLSCKKQ